MTVRLLSLCCALGACLGSARADLLWSNVSKIPADLETTGDAWSAVRANDPDFVSYRCAADDVWFDQPVKIDRMIYYSVPIGDPEILGGDFYVWTVGADGHPDKLVAWGADLDHTYEDTGWSNPNFGPIMRNIISPANLVLDPGAYFIGFRTYQTFVNHTGKDTNGILTTRQVHGSYQAHWSFDVLTDGTTSGPWYTMDAFNGVKENEWAFELEGALVPEPATWLALAAGSALLMRRRRRG